MLFGVLCMVAAFAVGAAAAEPVTLTIDSWRTDDYAVWRDQIIPAYQATHPDIKLQFKPTLPEQYNATLKSHLDAGTAGDLVTCRPFDASLQLFKEGHLLPLNELKGVKNFAALSRMAWSTDDGNVTYCMPVASVLHGFVYNKDAFAKLKIMPPVTVSDFFAVLDKIKADGSYIPLAIGTKDGWETASMGYQNIGPTYYKGEEGRMALIAGKNKLTDPRWVEPFRVLANWRPYLGEGFQTRSYTDSQALFAQGRAAIYPAGSWEIPGFTKKAAFKLGVFRPPVQKAWEKCYISDHPDLAIGVNAKSLHAAEAKAFLEWVASTSFATLYSNALPGFFSLNKGKVELKNQLAQEFASWRGDCGTTIRPTYHILSRGKPNLENEFWVKGAAVINGTQTPEAAAKVLQKGLDGWYRPDDWLSVRAAAVHVFTD